MTAHLTDAELVDLLNGASPAARAPHLACCDRCAQRLADLQAMAEEVRGVVAPEPSPLFWDHLSARVREAVAAEPPPRSSVRFAAGPWLRAGALWIGVAAAVLVVAVAMRSGRPTMWKAESPTASQTRAADASAEGGASDDPSLGLVADLVAELTWEGVNEAGLTSHVGADDDAVAQLSEGNGAR